MRPSAEQLAMRDPALAALMGIIPGDNFGADSFGAEFGDDEDFGDDDDWGDDDYGDDDFEAEFGDDDEFGARRRKKKKSAHKARPTSSKMMALWSKHAKQAAHTQSREMKLEPNKHSAVKVERYAFTISQAITMGTAVALALTGNPDTTIRPQRVSMNAPTPMFAFITEIKVANVSVTVGAGFEDAFNYSSLGVGQSLDMPTLSPANRASVLGNYTGFTPPGFTAGTAVYFSATLKGPASIVA